MDARGVIQRLWEVVEPVVTFQGMELAELEFQREPRGWVLRLYVDREGGTTLTDCSAVSREVGDVLDVEDLIRHPYHLEVSSPGLNRPVRKPKDFHRFTGRRIRVHFSEPVDGRRAVEGTLAGLDGGTVRLAAEGGVMEVPLSRISKARLVYSWGKDSVKE